MRPFELRDLCKERGLSETGGAAELRATLRAATGVVPDKATGTSSSVGNPVDDADSDGGAESDDDSDESSPGDSEEGFVVRKAPEPSSHLISNSDATGGDAVE